MAGSTALRWGGATNVGRVRTINEDNYMARDDVDLWAVADGMGGHRGGEVASGIACAALGQAFADRTVEGLVDAVEHANAAVFDAAAGNPDLGGMGTTVVALAVVDEGGDDMLAVANVGDSRVYRLAGSDLDQLTEDHSLVADLVRQGRLSREAAEELVRLAVAGGGRDNVTVVVVDVIDDGGRAEVASAALAGEPTAETVRGVGGPRPSGAY